MSSPEESPAPPPPHSSSSSPPPPDSSGSPPTPDSTTAPPPSDSSSSSPQPDSSSSSPPPDSSNSSPPSSPPPPSKSDSPSPPSPSKSNSPPPPSGSNNRSPPPSPPSSDDDGGNDNQNRSPPPPRSSHDKTQSPPPPPPRSGSNNSPRGSSPQLPNSSSDNDSSSNQKAIIAGASAGAGLLLLIVIVVMVLCCRKKKRKPSDENYYRDTPNKNMNNYYNTGGQNYYNTGPGPSTDHIVKIPPPPGSAGVSSEHNWQIAPPPPPPPLMSSSEMSSAGFSGAALPPPHPGMSLGFNQSSFTYEALSAATGGFAQSNLLGQGGFGYVHKGVLPNGREVAVKSLKLNSGQGDREFQAEVDIISRVHHRHLVSLVGYCTTGTQRMLVYEYVDNKTLEYHLHGEGLPVMDWLTRLKIALGSAKGFAYLHEDCHPRIIHRDIKAANILVDMNFEAMVADFGLAKLSQDNNTHVSTRIMGTFGYLAPEYASSGKLTEKSDVYSFGIMLLELITGRRPIDLSSDEDSLVDWARPILMEATEGGGSYEELVDSRLQNNYDPHEMLRMVACAAACIRQSARRRPKMSQIVRALEGDVSLDDLNAAVRGNRSLFGSSIGSDSDLKKLAKTNGALSSQEFTNSSDDGHTGEFAHRHN